MIKYVIKKNGDREAFSESKIKRAIEAAAKEARIPAERISGIAAEVSGNILKELTGTEEVSTQIIREKILEKLGKTERRVADAWLRYEETKRRKNQEF
jgi:transcriptional regulator NrdR family protein